MNAYILILIMMNSDTSFAYSIEFGSKSTCVEAMNTLRQSFMEKPFAKNFSAHCVIK